VEVREEGGTPAIVESIRAGLAMKTKQTVISSVPDPPDPHVFGPPGSGSIWQRYGSGSGSFYHQAKIVRITLIPTVLYCDFFWTFFFEK
jgi:hypothetical protein